MEQAPARVDPEPNPERSVARDVDQGSKAGQTFMNFPVKTTTFAHLKNLV